jgi:haloacetate dehalogenase
MAVVPKFIESDAYAEYRRCFNDPATIHASYEDYRAAASIGLAHDEADMDRKISCPVLVLWGANGLVDRKYDVLAIWRDGRHKYRARACHPVTGLPKKCRMTHWWK